MTLPYNRSFHIHKSQKVIIIWCAKAACTTVNHMYFEHENVLNEVIHKYKSIHKYRKEYQLLHKSIRKKCIHNFSKLNYIQFTVNPYRRAVSSYIHGMKFKYIDSKYKNISFHMFILFLLKGIIPPNPHHNLQTFFKNTYDNIYIIHMENMKNGLDYINNTFNLHYKPYSNQNVKNKSNKFNHFIGKEKWENIKDNIPNDYTLFYNPIIKELVEVLYKEDFEHLEYTWDMFIDYEQQKNSI